jgi:hypothetical protein
MKTRVRNHFFSIFVSLMICLISTMLIRPVNVSGEEYPGEGKDQLVQALDIAFLNVMRSGQWRQIYQSLSSIVVNLSDCYPNPDIMVYPENPTGLLESILTNKQIKVCTYEAQSGGSGAIFQEVNVQMLRAIMDEIGKAYNLSESIEVVEVYRFGGTALFTALNDGSCDVMDTVASLGGVSSGTRRRELARFTCTIVGSGQFLQVREDSSYQSMDDVLADQNAKICSGQLSTRLANAYFQNHEVTTIFPPDDDIEVCSQGVLDGTYAVYIYFDPTPAKEGLRSIDTGIVAGTPYWVAGNQDQDRDTIPDAEDNCPDAYNPCQEDGDGDGTGDACEDATDTTTSTTSPTTTTINNICPSQVIYGGYSRETELLRYFRDDVLSQTPEGQEIIRLYYQWSPAIVKAMEADDDFKAEVKEMIDGVLGLI